MSNRIVFPALNQCRSAFRASWYPIVVSALQKNVKLYMAIYARSGQYRNLWVRSDCYLHAWMPSDPGSCWRNEAYVLVYGRIASMKPQVQAPDCLESENFALVFGQRGGENWVGSPWRTCVVPTALFSLQRVIHEEGWTSNKA